MMAMHSYSDLHPARKIAAPTRRNRCPDPVAAAILTYFLSILYIYYKPAPDPLFVMQAVIAVAAVAVGAVALAAAIAVALATICAGGRKPGLELIRHLAERCQGQHQAE